MRAAVSRIQSTGPMGPGPRGSPEHRIDVLERELTRLGDDVDRALDVGGKWTRRTATTHTAVQPWELVLCNPTAGGFRVVLPDPTKCLLARVQVKNDSTSTNAITIVVIDGGRIDGATSVVINTARASTLLVSNGFEWKRLALDSDVSAFPGPTVTTATISSDQNDYTQTGFASAFLVRVVTDTTLRKFTGFAFDSATRLAKILVNTTADPFIIAHQSASSAAANRVICPNGWDLPVMPGCAAWLEYDSVDTRWRAFPFADAASYPAAILEVQFGTSNPTTNDVSTTVPASPSGNQRFLLEAFEVWSAGIGGGDAGTVTLSMGTAAGGTQIMLAQAITSATTGGIQGGYSLASLGTDVLINNGYRLALNASANIYLRAATTVGSVSSGKKARAYIYGSFLP